MPATMTLEDFLRDTTTRVNAALERYLPSEKKVPETLHESVRYSIFAGGKRLRPALCVAAYEACGGDAQKEPVWMAAAAIEMTHTFSLIHDDLPCMDDDDMRRGRPTNHKVFGEALAVLSGDWLAVYAFDLLAKTGDIRCIGTLAQALGSDGMLGGQVVDIQSEGKTVDLATVEYIHWHKTAALIQASLVMGGQLAHADEATLSGLADYGSRIGVAFQIVDDILDLEQTTEALGKDAKSDLARGKATYPAIVGLEASKVKARELVDQAVSDVKRLPIRSEVFELLADFIVTRVN